MNNNSVDASGSTRLWMRRRLAVIGGSVIALCAAGKVGSEPGPDAAPPARKLMTPADLQALPAQAADHKLGYGEDPNHFGELRAPSGPGPHPVVVLVHGGCWKEPYADLPDLAPMGDAAGRVRITTRDAL